MNQIITQHGWCLNSNMWLNVKKKFKADNLLWQDNERGYFYSKSKKAGWIENNNINNFRMVISHSLGTQLINPNILNKASHAVLINSFFNFIPNNNRRNFTIRASRKMEKKLMIKKLNL